MKNVNYIDTIKDVTSKLLPKFVSRYESEHNFKLPKITVLTIGGYIKNPNDVVVNNKPPEFGHINVNVEVDVKDGRIGIVKKLVLNVLERVMDSIGFQYDEIYVNYITTAQLNRDNIEKLESTIYKLLYSYDKHEGWYSLPYSESNEDGVDWIVKGKVTKVIVRPKEVSIRGYKLDCIYDVLVTFSVTKILIGFKSENDWEEVYREHDLPSHSWDTIIDDIELYVTKMIPQICEVDVDYDFSRTLRN